MRKQRLLLVNKSTKNSFSHSAVSKTACPLLLFFFLIVPISVTADKASELKEIRTRIKDVESRIQGARDEAEKLQKELRENEITTAQTLTRLHDFELNISNKHAELAELKFEKAEHESALTAEKEKLKHQIRSAY